MERYICVHGHFYQPPRENAWLEYVETQDSAYPFHDWNEKVTTECYGPNYASRILDSKGLITEISNNYAKISFDFGPTLLSWLETNSPDTYQAVLDSDKESMRNFGGHGSAMAQAYNHIIMPLANRRDKVTQVTWGIQDFEFRFGRKPEGMWLPETAVDLETLDIMAERGIKFTVLAPHQASKVRHMGKAHWRNVADAAIDPSMAYQLNLPSGRKLAIFFYDGPVSHAVAFEDILKNGDDFAKRLTGAFSEKRTWPQLVHIATDGETYGHHRRFGDMALAFALRLLEKNRLVRLTNYGEYLARNPPTREVTIIENTSWSCPHGVEHWRSDCGCNTGQNKVCLQTWRAPLRQAMDWLRDTLAPRYEEMAARFLKEPWSARNDYIKVILDRSTADVNKFLEKHRTRELSKDEEVTVLKLLELQRHAMLMFTSCGWFFDELSGIETIQVMQYAGRAAQLATELFGDDVETNFLERLALAKSNLPEYTDGRHIYDEFVKPARVDLNRVAAHLAGSSLFEDYAKQSEIHCYHANLENYRTADCGKGRLATGQADITSTITRESAIFNFGAVYAGNDNFSVGASKSFDDDTFQKMARDVIDACAANDPSAVTRLLNKYFGTLPYGLKDLLGDERRKILDSIFGKSLSELEETYYQIYQHYSSPVSAINKSSPVPRSYQQAANFILSTALRRALQKEPLPQKHINRLLEETRMWQIKLDTEALSYLMQQQMEKAMGRFVTAPEDAAFLKEVATAANLLPVLPFRVDLWKVQYLYYKMLKTIYPQMQKTASAEWWENFISLGKQLSIEVNAFIS